MNDDATPAKVLFTDGLGRAVAEAGQWCAGIATNGANVGRVYVESDDFTHDVRMYVDGDFGSPAEKLAYAIEIARWLNSREPTAEIERLRAALAAIEKHSANTIRTNSKDRGDWAEDIAFVGKLARDAIGAA